MQSHATPGYIHLCHQIVGSELERNALCGSNEIALFQWECWRANEEAFCPECLARHRKKLAEAAGAAQARMEKP